MGSSTEMSPRESPFMGYILIVDDLAIIRQPIEAALVKEGFETRSAENGLKALTLAAASKPDLVILDLAMPVMDGFTFLTRLRASDQLKSVPVLILTGNQQRASVVRALSLGVSGYLLKSQFTLENLVQHVRRLVPGASGARSSSDEKAA
jgi:PleD family two-component response regulator